jgi:glycosyltransferase involved in cell wall biosynthesis
LNTPLVSVIVPAYNNEAYLDKCLTSIFYQKYRPIEVIVSDDNSPCDLSLVVKKYQRKSNKNILIKYYRQHSNLGFYLNNIFSLNKASGKYATFLFHDDWIINDEFYIETVRIMENHTNCFVCIGNSQMEETQDIYMDFHSANYNYICGRDFIAKRLYNDLHPVHSAVIFNLDEYRKLPYTSFLVEKKDILKMNIQMDEAFLSINLLAANGIIAITGKLCSIKGTPKNSVSKSDLWRNNYQLGLFIVFFKLYLYYLSLGYSDCAKEMKRLIIFRYSVPRPNINVLIYLNFNFLALKFMLFSFLVNICKGFIRKLIIPLRYIFYRFIKY